jgi:PIN domain nuclease of toxin-antitoxin system
VIYLLDTHTLVWSIVESSKLSPVAREIIENRNNKIIVSTVSFWEISLKTALQKFEFFGVDIESIPVFAKELGFSLLPLEGDDSISFHKLPAEDSHKDPFDRMISWQAICGNYTLISRDSVFRNYEKYGLKLIW